MLISKPVATDCPRGTSCSVGVNTNPSSAVVTVFVVPVIVKTPLLIVLPSLAAFGSESVPFAVSLGLTVTVSVGVPTLGAAMTTPANGLTAFASVVVWLASVPTISVGGPSVAVKP
jgi:hypothetical protein